MWHNGPASRETADRLTLVTRWGHFNFDRPVLIHPGETMWVEDGHLMVERVSGEVAARAGLRAAGPDDPRGAFTE